MISVSAYPPEHYLNSGAREVLFVYCVDAPELDERGLCRDCLFRCGGECGANPLGDAEKICPFLEIDPKVSGLKTRVKERKRK